MLDRYLEGTLTPREMSEIATHLRTCGACSRLLEEVKVVDALLFTTSVPELPANFTFAVLAETRSLPAPKPHEHRVWSFVALYLTAAWMAGLAIFLTSGANVGRIGAAFAFGFNNVTQALNDGASGIGHGAPLLATFSVGVLLIDLALAAAVGISYFVVRPRLAAHLASVSEAK